ncbi:hypothetical protein QJS04_geneDACA022180 [Acorus gramineus]|uniref:Cytochrome b561 and DOMON domain-containing protein n=1 Tax=Acorus gramineus TaxID=55184 RepID=A0AAV9BBR2_ACOGR|nr:hypothetical protein QJS04_geneDACA022180 [Acorus gramineus]
MYTPLHQKQNHQNTMHLPHLLHLILLFLLLAPPRIALASSHCTTAASKTYHNCLSLPTQQASLAWTLHARTATLDLAFTGSLLAPSGWVGFGVNPGNNAPEMVGARALIAFADPSTGATVALPFVLDDSTKLQKAPLRSRPLDIPLSASETSVLADRATVSIRATLRLAHNRTKINLVWNRGAYVQGYSPTIHPMDAPALNSRATIDILTTASTSVPHTPTALLRTLHACLNSASWGLMLPIGAALARHLKQLSPSPAPTWFYAHAGTQLAGFTLGTFGFGTGLWLGGQSVGVVHEAHRKLGVAVFCVGGLQMMALMCRPTATHRLRKYWKSYHHLVGYACVVMGVVNVFQGFEVMGLWRSYWRLGYCVVLASLVGVFVALEANSWVLFCRKAREEEMRREGVVGGKKGFGDDEI